MSEDQKQPRQDHTEERAAFERDLIASLHRDGPIVGVKKTDVRDEMAARGIIDEDMRANLSGIITEVIAGLESRGDIVLVKGTPNGKVITEVWLASDPNAPEPGEHVCPNPSADDIVLSFNDSMFDLRSERDALLERVAELERQVEELEEAVTTPMVTSAVTQLSQTVQDVQDPRFARTGRGNLPTRP